MFLYLSLLEIDLKWLNTGFQKRLTSSSLHLHKYLNAELTDFPFLCFNWYAGSVHKDNEVCPVVGCWESLSDQQRASQVLKRAPASSVQSFTNIIPVAIQLIYSWCHGQPVKSTADCAFSVRCPHLNQDTCLVGFGTVFFLLVGFLCLFCHLT